MTELEADSAGNHTRNPHDNISTHTERRDEERKSRRVHTRKEGGMAYKIPVGYPTGRS
jgi:hypothetical protein